MIVLQSLRVNTFLDKKQISRILMNNTLRHLTSANWFQFLFIYPLKLVVQVYCFYVFQIASLFMVNSFVISVLSRSKESRFLKRQSLPALRQSSITRESLWWRRHLERWVSTSVRILILMITSFSSAHIQFCSTTIGEWKGRQITCRAHGEATTRQRRDQRRWE